MSSALWTWLFIIAAFVASLLGHPAATAVCVVFTLMHWFIDAFHNEAELREKRRAKRIMAAMVAMEEAKGKGDE